LEPVRLGTFQPRTKTESNRTKMSVFLILGFGSCFPILRLSASALVLEATATEKTWNQTNPRVGGERHGTLRPPHAHNALGPICTAQRAQHASTPPRHTRPHFSTHGVTVHPHPGWAGRLWPQNLTLASASTERGSRWRAGGGVSKSA
jgi:hypothetical protein